MWVLINGPAGSGKDTLGQLLHKELNFRGKRSRLCKFAQPIKEALKVFFNLDWDEYYKYFESPEKNKPQDRFFGVTPRQALINLSEVYAKPLFGRGVFGKLALQTAPTGTKINIVTDAGFHPEAAEIINQMGAQSVVIFQLHRKGLTFENDSREYVNLGEVHIISTDCTNGESLAAIVKILENKGWI